jgi:hypothetical protein
MTLIFYVYCSQELYQATDDTYATLDELQTMFPTSAFLQTQHALLFYHNKGNPVSNHFLFQSDAKCHQTLSERQISSTKSWLHHHIA